MDNTSLVSICIPTYEANGEGLPFLKTLLASILQQTYTNREIIVSDHSKDGVIEQYIEFVNRVLAKKIRYLRYEEHRGEPAWNTNNAIKHAKGKFVKLMNMDDYLFNEHSLNNMIAILNQEGAEWLLSGCVHYDYKKKLLYNPMYPRIEGDGEHLLRGLNYIGCPSVGLIPAGEFFDTEVSYMIDCELWYRMFKKYGLPAILKEHAVVIGIGDHTLTNQVADKEKELLESDIKYCYEKYTTIRSEV